MEYETTLKGLREDKNQFVERIKKSAHVSKMSDISSMDEQTRSILERKIKLIQDYAKVVQKCSHLDVGIFNIITELISVYEGEPYVLRNIDVHRDKTSPSRVFLTSMIMPKSTYEKIKNPHYMRERYFHHLLKNGYAINPYSDVEKEIILGPYAFSFYEVDSMGRLNPTFSYKGFPYVKEFIDFLIDYKMEKNQLRLTLREMNQLKDEFIRRNQEDIKKNYQQKQERKIQQATASIQKEYNHQEQLLSRSIKRMGTKS